MTQLVRKIWPMLVANELMKIDPSLRGGDSSLRDRVLELRAQGLTQSAIANAVGCTQGHVSHLLSGKIGTSHKTKAEPQIKAAILDGSVSYQAMLEKHGGKRAAAKAMGLAESTFRDRLAKELAGKATLR